MLEGYAKTSGNMSDMCLDIVCGFSAPLTLTGYGYRLLISFTDIGQYSSGAVFYMKRIALTPKLDVLMLNSTLLLL